MDGYSYVSGNPYNKLKYSGKELDQSRERCPLPAGCRDEIIHEYPDNTLTSCSQIGMKSSMISEGNTNTTLAGRSIAEIPIYRGGIITRSLAAGWWWTRPGNLPARMWGWAITPLATMMKMDSGFG